MKNEDFDAVDEQSKGKPIASQIRAFWRRRWYVLAPLFLFGLPSFIVAELWPLLYRSQALILVEGQKVPEQYVTPNVVTTLQTRLDSMTQRILSRTQLQRVIEDFGLYPKERSRMVMDDVVELMRKNISVEAVQTQARNGDLTGFRIAYSANDPKTAQRVTNEITSLFIEESLRSRTQQSLSTTTFLETQLEQARKDLEEQEKQLRQYKGQFMGELPEQEQANLQVLSSLQAQFYAVTEALARADQQRIYLESVKSQYARMDKKAGTSIVNGRVVTTSPERKAAEDTLLELRHQFADAQVRYTDKHPTVVRLKREIASWEQRVAELDKAEKAAEKAEADAVAAKGPADPAEKAVPAVADPALIDVDSRLKAVAAEIENYQKDQKTLKDRITDIQGHLNLTPVREQQLADVTRRYENSRANYQSLLQKKMQSELASNLEKRQQGEQFRILDPASLPHKGQGRMPIIVGGGALGLCIGFALLVIRTFLDQTILDKDDLATQTDVPILIRLPVLTTPRERRRKLLHGLVEVTSVVLLVGVALGGAVRMYLSA